MTDTQRTALRIANRIHLFLIRELGHGIDVEQMLNRPVYARDVLLVCEACQDVELTQLARQFRSVAPSSPGDVRLSPMGSRVLPGHAQQPLGWSRDTSGFGAPDLGGHLPPHHSRRRIQQSWWSRFLSPRE
ncbi:MAG: hypothetical protein HY021_12610 [Burkholderiales bacterium]|nr:hypothetical protein [Burkholderiales bacterium]